MYLLEGSKSSILLNGGLSCLVPEVVAQLREFAIDQSKIDKFLVLHSHFDHVGIIPYFKRHYPHIVVHASVRALEILNKPKAIQVINESNRYFTRKQGLEQVCSEYGVEWPLGISGSAVREGDRIDLGDLELRIIETPGHSPCSISAYVPQLKLLFPSEAAGVPLATGLMTYGTSNFTQFETSLRKLKDLEIELVCCDHCGCVAGEEARGFVAASIESAKWRKRLMQETYQRTGSVELAARELAARFEGENRLDIVPKETFLESYRHMIMHVVGLKKGVASPQST